jgi:hypothetical protein
MRDKIELPIKVVNGERWADFTVYGKSHEICGTTVKSKADFSFAGEHRVRLFKFTSCVHWKLPSGVIDITDVAPAEAPRRIQGR